VRRSSCTPKEWNVPMNGFSPLPFTIAETRSPISRAALLVNVIARMLAGGTFLASIR
jgi:hypothetical protein